MKYTFDILNHTIHEGHEKYFSVAGSMREDRKREFLPLNETYQLKISSKAIMLCDIEKNPVWETPVECPGIPNNAWISERRMLVTTNSEDYHAWGHLGPALIIDLENGTIVKEIRGSHGEALSGGRFIIGLEGYDVFDTWLYNDQGEIVQQWRSCGHYIVSEDDTIRVIEQDRRTPTNGYVVRLNHDGTIDKGFKLRTCAASNPLLLENEELLFDHSGQIILLNKDLSKIAQLKLLTISERESWRFYSKIKRKNEDELSVFIMERTSGDIHPIEYKTHEWKIKINRN